MPNAMNLQDFIKGLKDEVIKGIVLDFARQSTLFQLLLPFRGVGAFALKQWRATKVTDAVFRDIGEGFANTKDEFEEVLEGVYLLGGRVDLDSALTLVKDVYRELDPLAENVALQARRYEYAYLDKFINGDRADAAYKGFNGIKKRVTDVGGDQVINAATGGVPLDLAASSANRQKFLDLIQQAIFETAEGRPDFVVSSKQGLWQLTRVARREGLLDTTKDVFDRDIQTFAGIKLIWAGTKGDQSTQIITTAEDAGDAGNNSTSYYFVRLGVPYVQGIQLGAPERTFDAIIDDGVTRRIVFQWPVGLLATHKKSIVRIKGVKPI